MVSILSVLDTPTPSPSRQGSWANFGPSIRYWPPLLNIVAYPGIDYRTRLGE